LSFKEYLKYDDPLIPGIATGLGAGIGRRGSLCGNFTGSVIVIGMKFGRSAPGDDDSKEKVYRKVHRFWSRFEKEFGSCYCYDLIACHLDNEEERRRWLAAGGMEKCAAIVEKTARMLHELIEEV
jgi:C_GCAxxG_C_C family probable redox protein